MYTLFQSAANTTTNGTAIGTAGQDVRVFGIIIGAPVASGNIALYSITNPIGGANMAAASTANIAAKITLPATLPTTGAEQAITRMFGPYGLPLADGGNIMIDQTMQVTVIWGIADNSQI